MGVSKNQGPHHRPQIVGLAFLWSAIWDHNIIAGTNETILHLPYINPKNLANTPEKGAQFVETAIYAYH